MFGLPDILIACFLFVAWHRARREQLGSAELLDVDSEIYQ